MLNFDELLGGNPDDEKPLSKQNQWLLDHLSDGKPHSGDEIRLRSRLALGDEITLHPRITDLRERGWIIETYRMGKKNHFRLTGRGEQVEGRTTKTAVQGYIFTSVAGDDPRNGNVCQIIGRAATDTEQLTHGPMFQVKFGDGEVDTAFAMELSPWYPV